MRTTLHPISHPRSHPTHLDGRSPPRNHLAPRNNLAAWQILNGGTFPEVFPHPMSRVTLLGCVSRVALDHLDKRCPSKVNLMMQQRCAQQRLKQARLGQRHSEKWKAPVAGNN